jgi:dihydrofolate synthase/folylpolyglutamate synthase
MTYQETIEFLFSQLPMYQRKGKAAYKADLSNTIALCEQLGNPEKRIKTIHVAGTNGKGSASHFIASILQESGYKVGLYTSPHLLDFRERIRINGNMVSEEDVVDFVKTKHAILQNIEPSFFEWTVGLAFSYFEKEQVDIAVIETGLGGRLDSTNVINPLVSVITNIGLDHTQFLGDTLEKVASEKAGIIKGDTPIVIGETQFQLDQLFLERAENLGSEIVFADQQSEFIASTGLVNYQRKNAQTAVVSVKQLRAFGFEVSNNDLVKGIEHMVRNTGLRGRWEVLQQKPLVIADTAHNKEGLLYTMEQVAATAYNKLRIVFGMVNDKDAASILELLPSGAEYYLCEPSIERAMPLNKLEEFFQKRNFSKKIFPSVMDAKNAAIADSQDDDMVYIGGSTFVVADAL